MSETFEDVLAHYGIKGQKWGVRRRAGKDGTVGSTAKSDDTAPADDAVKALAYRQIAKKNGTQALSNQELQLLLNRVELEKKYSKNFGESEKKSGKKFVQELLREEGKKQTRSVVSAAATVAVASAFAKRAAKSTNPMVGEIAKKLA